MGMEKKKTKLFELYTSFFKVGLFTFGGGYAMIPIIEREVVKNKNWVSYEEMLDYYAVSQTTPGIIMVNTATFIGYNERGILGAIVCTLGAISPSLIIICLIASLIENFADIPLVKSALKGISAGICAIMISSVIKLGKSAIKSSISAAFALIGFVVAYFTNISIVYPIAFALVVSILINSIKESKK